MNLNPTKKLPSAMFAGVLALSLAGCAMQQGASASAAPAGGEGFSPTASATTTTGETIDTENQFSKRDLAQTADLEDATALTLVDGQDIQITEEGVYTVSGTASEATIVVDASKDAKVQIVLDGVSITNGDSPAIYVKSADKVFVTTASGSENTLTVTGEFVADGETNTDAVIFSKDDLTLNGEGTLTVNSTKNGISGHDDLTITGGAYVVNAVADAFEAHDSIAIAGGTFDIVTQKDGFNCGNDDDPSVGYIYIEDGAFNIDAGDDGIQATTIMQIAGGTFNISASEGIEGTYVIVDGGTISIEASDDGINAAAKSNAYSVLIEINGGDIAIDMASGDTDALDANGSMVINGGNLDINATSAFDYDVSGELNGGTVVVNGEEVTELTNSMMGGMGGGMHGGGMGGGAGMGGMGGGNMGGGRGGRG